MACCLHCVARCLTWIPKHSSIKFNWPGCVPACVWETKGIQENVPPIDWLALMPQTRSPGWGILHWTSVSPSAWLVSKFTCGWYWTCGRSVVTTHITRQPSSQPEPVSSPNMHDQKVGAFAGCLFLLLAAEGKPCSAICCHRCKYLIPFNYDWPGSTHWGPPVHNA